MAISAALSGVTDWDEMEEFGKYKLPWLRQFYPFKNGIPSHDTINRLFSALNPEEFFECFNQWTSLLKQRYEHEVIAIDGKTIKGTNPKAKGMECLYYVSAYASENGLVLAQQTTQEKSNEITAIPKLLDMIDIQGCIVTVDALNCQKTLAKKVVDKKADYLFAVKNNQQELYDQIRGRFENQSVDDQNVEEDIGHGRIEKRTCKVICNLDFVDNAPQWEGLRSIVQIQAQRTQKATGKTQTETRYYISSLPADAQLINRSARKHWFIENKLHWVLDVSFNEDKSRKRKEYSAQNYSIIIKAALNMLKNKPKTMSYKRMKLKALLNDQAREDLLFI